MALRSTLVHIAGLVSTMAACSSSTSSSFPTNDGGPDDGGDSGPVACGGCSCGTPSTPKGSASHAQACAIASEQVAVGGDACKAFCGSLPRNAPSQTYFCTLPPDYTTAYRDAQPDAGSSADGGSSVDAGSTCPAWTDDVVVQCGFPCLGRRTEGVADPAPSDPRALGAVFANRAYLEAVSVHAFARLERELTFHRAPPELLHKTRRARRDEIRHTAMALRLARRYGGAASLPETPTEGLPRSLFLIACENAVEGCVRETYGAVLGLLEASLSSDATVRRASRRIANDECRHAELAMAVACWMDQLLTEVERAAVRKAVAEAIEDLRTRGDARVVNLLAAHVWGDATFTLAA